MPILNPRRLLTPQGKSELLVNLIEEDGAGLFFDTNAYLVSAVEIDPATSAVTSRTLAGGGLGTGLALTADGEVSTSAAQKTYTATGVLAPSMTDAASPVTVIGVLLSSDGTAASALAFLEFDDPITLDEVAERIQYAIEFGFDGQELYVVPRVLPIGA